MVCIIFSLLSNTVRDAVPVARCHNRMRACVRSACVRACERAISPLDVVSNSHHFRAHEEIGGLWSGGPVLLRSRAPYLHRLPPTHIPLHSATESAASAPATEDAAAAGGGADELVEFRVVFERETHIIEFGLDRTIVELKQHLEKTLNCPAATQKLMYKGCVE